MTWEVESDNRARRELRRLDGSVQRQILRYLRVCASPRGFGGALTGDRIELWRYRVGDYRLICKIEDDQLTVLVLAVGHRREVYEQE